MRRMVSFVKRWLVPGTLPFLFAGVIAGALLLNFGAPAAGAGWVTTLAASYYLLSLPAVARTLINRLSRNYHPLPDDQCIGTRASVLVAVGNGAVHYTNGIDRVDYLTRRSVFTVFEAARVYRLARPARIVVTGGLRSPGAASESELMRALLVECGIDDRCIVTESESRTTAEQAANVASLVGREITAGPALVVTTPAHMPRVVREFRAAGVQVIPCATPELNYDDGVTGWHRWLPSMSSLTGSSSATYEYMASALSALTRRTS